VSASRFRFDHAVIVVPALAEAIATFLDAGFVVVPGGRHDTIPTENALIGLADGSYIELLAMRDGEAREEVRRATRDPARWARHLDGASAVARRFLPRLGREDGVVDVALAGERLARFASESRRRGFEMTGPVAFGRARPDGESLAMELLFPAADYLPFLIEDRTPRERRVPGGSEAVAHPNGSRGVARVRVHAASAATATLAWADLFAATPHARSDGATELAIGTTAVTIEAGTPEGAFGVTLAGAGALPPAVEALGVHGDRSG
jgi:hypothetical protein